MKLRPWGYPLTTAEALRQQYADYKIYVLEKTVDNIIREFDKQNSLVILICDSKRELHSELSNNSEVTEALIKLGYTVNKVQPKPLIINIFGFKLQIGKTKKPNFIISAEKK